MSVNRLGLRLFTYLYWSAVVALLREVILVAQPVLEADHVDVGGDHRVCHIANSLSNNNNLIFISISSACATKVYNKHKSKYYFH